MRLISLPYCMSKKSRSISYSKLLYVITLVTQNTPELLELDKTSWQYGMNIFMFFLQEDTAVISKRFKAMHMNLVYLYIGSILYIKKVLPHFILYTVYPRSCDPFYIVTWYIKWTTTSWTHSSRPYEMGKNF